MYSGFITSKRALKSVGVHQRFDAVAYRMVEPYLTEGTFPPLRQVLHFEGVNGPDGLKVKSPSKDEPSHLYDPVSGTGPIPELIKRHYQALVDRLKAEDYVRSAFEAAWLAHFICDGLTPAHHFPLDKQIADQGAEKTDRGRYRVRQPGDTGMQIARKGWAMIGGKGLLTTHFNFEMGVATALIGQRIKAQLDAAKLAQAKKIGIIAFFKQEAKDISEMQMYERFYKRGWDGVLGRQLKTKLAPQIIQCIAIAWLLAYLEAGKELAKDANAATEMVTEL